MWKKKKKKKKKKKIQSLKVHVAFGETFYSVEKTLFLFCLNKLNKQTAHDNTV